LPLAKTGLGPRLNDFARNLVICPRCLQISKPFWLAFILAAMKDFHRIRGLSFFLLRHDQPSL
jgi:hypothetical protein